MATVAEMLGGASAQSSAPGPPPPPPGFVPQAAPPPPPGFQLETSPPKTASLLGQMGAAIVDPLKALGHDAARYYQAASTPTLPKSPLELIPGFSPQEKAAGSMIGDVGAIAGSPANALVVQPVAALADKLPAPIDMKTGKPMTPEQQHATNVDAISQALMALGPKGKAGAPAAAMDAAYATKVAKVAAEVPREVVLDPYGKFTADGREIIGKAAGHDVAPEDLSNAYDVAEQQKAAQAAPEPPTAPQPEPTAVQPAPAEPAPAAAPQVEAAPAPEPPPVPEPDPSGLALETPDATLPQTARQRVADASEFGIDYSKGQATQSFVDQLKEEILRNETSASGAEAKAWFANQRQQINTAFDQVQGVFGDTSLSGEDRGNIVRDAMRGLEGQGAAGVKAQYDLMREIATKLGGENPDLIKVDSPELRQGVDELLHEPLLEDRVRNTIEQEAARYGLIGTEPRTAAGKTSVKLLDTNGEPARSVTFVGQPEALTLSNAENFRQRLNKLYDVDDTGLTQQLKHTLDRAMQETAARAAENGGPELQQAAQKARQMSIAQRRTFEANDPIEKVLAWKRGSGDTTPEVAAEKVIEAVGKDLGSLRKLKMILLSGATPESKAAWEAVRAHELAKIIDQAWVRNANLGEGEVGAFSGAKLNTAFAKIGVPKLKVLFNDEELNRLMKFRRVVQNATVPVKGTQNPSGSAHMFFHLLKQSGGGLARLLGPLAHPPMAVAHGAAKLYQAGAQAAEAKQTLAGVTSFAEAVAKEPNAKNAQAFVDAVKSPGLIKAIMYAGNAQQETERKVSEIR